MPGLRQGRCQSPTVVFLATKEPEFLASVFKPIMELFPVLHFDFKGSRGDWF